MNLLALRTEVLAHGFESAFFSSRIDQYLNRAYKAVVRRVDYYIDEATKAYATTGGATDLALPTDWARTRSLLNTDLGGSLMGVALGDIDNAPVVQGVPRFYAQDGQNLRLYPVPDGVYNLELRYWLMPADLVTDGDVPTIPPDWHDMLWWYAVGEAYAAEDDSQTAQYWQNRFESSLREFEANQRFPSSDMPTQAKSMWGDDTPLSAGGWRRF